MNRVNEERENPMEYCVSFSLEIYDKMLFFISQGTLSKQDWQMAGKFFPINFFISFINDHLGLYIVFAFKKIRSVPYDEDSNTSH